MEDLTALVNSQAVVFFSKDECPHCVALSNDLDSLQLPYRKVMLESDLRESLIELTGCKTIPQLFIGGRFVGGYKEFTTLCGTGRINQLLAPFGFSAVLDF